MGSALGTPALPSPFSMRKDAKRRGGLLDGKRTLTQTRPRQDPGLGSMRSEFLLFVACFCHHLQGLRQSQQ